MSTQTANSGPVLEYQKTIGIVNNGTNGRGFANPYDVLVSKDGRIFVVNRGAYVFARVGVCNLDEEYLYEFGSHGDEDGQFRYPTSIAMDGQDRVYVADEYHHRINVYDESGEFLQRWGVHGGGDGELDGPSGLVADREDNIYVVDQHNNRVQRFTPDGRYLSQWGEAGEGDGQFNLPWGITLDSEGNVYVADWRNDSIQKFTPDGEFLARFGEPGNGDGQFLRPSSVAVDPEGYIYVADWGNERVQVLGPDGGFHLKLRGQATLSKWAKEFLAVNPDEQVERDKSNLTPDLPSHFDTPYQVSSQTEPYFWGPVAVTVDGEGRLYVAETCRHRLQVYQKV